MSGLRILTIAAVALIAAFANIGVVSADAHSEAGSVAASAAAGPQRMTLPKGTIYIQGYLDFNLSTDAVAKPISLAPDVWYGLQDDISVGLIHSGNGGAGFFGAAGSGLCFTGEDNGCGSIYNNVGVAARYHLFDGTDEPVVLALDGGVFFRDLDPFQLSLKFGAVGKWSGPVDVVFGANLFLGITERDGDPLTGLGGNKETISIPVAVMYPVSEQLAAGVQTGFVLPLQNTGDFFAIPLALGARYVVTPVITVEGALSFPQLLGGEATAGFDGRVFTVGASYLM